MSAIAKIILVGFTLATIGGCKEQSNHLKSISVSWEVISNTHSDLPSSRSIFTISNNGKEILKGNWELYYNQTPRNKLEQGDTSIARVEHISGDWFRIIPNGDLEVKPGDQIEIIYESEYWYIKESDAPSGLYFVVKTRQDTEEIVEISNYTIKPFTRVEQIRRHTNNLEPLPTPQNSFLANKNLYLIPKEVLLPIVPSPSLVEKRGVTVNLSDTLIITYHNEKLQFEAQYLKQQLENLLNWNVELVNYSNPQNNAIVLSINESLGTHKEGYHLFIDEGLIRIEASEKSGVFYGIQSLISLLPIDDILSKRRTITLPRMLVTDSPRFGYRGVHLDVVRNFFPKETILKVIDILAFYKINTLHLHLTDDEGWRIEIPSLPELTSVGAQRGHTTKEAAALHPAYGSGPHPFAKGKSGSGFYTRQDFIEILQYAKDRHISVIPEINLPGHARAAIKAMEARYNFYMAKGDEVAANEFRLIDPDDQSVYLSAQFYNDNVVNVAKESTYRFFEAVIDEIVDIYSDANATLEIIHVGGDEVPKGAWSKSIIVDQLMEKCPDIKRYENMHAYFTERALEILSKRGLKMAGWEEIALHNNNGQEVNPKFANGNVTPYVWNSLWGAQDLAYRLANRGYPVVLCHVTNFYFDLAYGNHPKEPGLYWGGFVNTRSAWYYNPFDIFQTLRKDNFGKPVDIEIEYKDMERLKPEARKNIIGLQAQLWSETIQSPEMLEYYLLPKLIGFSETAWAKERRWEAEDDNSLREKKVNEDWNNFSNTLAKKELPKFKFLFGGYNYRLPPPGAIVEDGLLKANVEYPGLSIRYTLNGDEPTSTSPLYNNPIEIINKTGIKLKSFDVTGASSRTVEIKLNSDESFF